MFEWILSVEDFLSAWGQTFKKRGSHFVVNPNLPAIVKRYTPEANVFAVVAKCADASPGIFEELNRSIYAEITAREDTPVIDGDRRDSLVWSERIRRTYHISTNHLMAMFDMSDFIYADQTSRLEVAHTPLGRRLVERGALSAEGLGALRRSPLAYLRGAGGSMLEYLPDCAIGKDLDHIEGMLRGFAPDARDA